MKKYCKDIDILNKDLIKEATINCFRRKNKNRKDIRELIEKYPDINFLVENLRNELENEKLDLKPIWYKEKVDGSCGKVRIIGIQDIKQQIYDYIAVAGLKPMLRRIGEYQCASIPGRGQTNGVKRVAKWLGNYNIRYAGKLDIRKCYQSIDKDKLMAFLKKHVKNDKLLWLVNELLNTFESGLSIGSYLSQYLSNLYLSELYHEIAERMFRIKNKRNGTKERVNLVKHVLFYMDDILILGTNSKDISKAIKLIIAKADKMGLTIKPDWTIYKTSNNKFDNGQFIDMMGFRIYRDYVTIRRKTFIRLRRAFVRFVKRPTLALSKKCASYLGILKHTNSFKLIKKYKVEKLIKKAKRMVSRYDKGKICRATKRSKDYYKWQQC